MLSWPRKDVPRSLVIGNGNVLVGFDANYSVRDIFYPRVGDANHTMGNVCRTGFFIDGKFAWVSDPVWERHLGYAEDSLVSNVTLTATSLGSATIQGPGDLAAINLEAFLVFDVSLSGASPGWTISNPSPSWPAGSRCRRASAPAIAWPPSRPRLIRD